MIKGCHDTTLKTAIWRRTLDADRLGSMPIGDWAARPSQVFKAGLPPARKAAKTKAG